MDRIAQVLAQRGHQREGGPMLARRNRHRLSSAAAGALTVAALAAAMATATCAAPAPAQPSKPTPPAVVPAQGRPFVPVQGDWEGTAGGFEASFNLVLDAV